MRVHVNTLEGSEYATAFHASFGEGDLVESLGQVRDDDVFPASDLDEGGVYVR